MKFHSERLTRLTRAMVANASAVVSLSEKLAQNKVLAKIIGAVKAPQKIACQLLVSKQATV